MSAHLDGGSREGAVNRVELVARWADDLAHEIKNPLHAMAVNLELVKSRAGDAAGLRERAEVVESELHRVHALVDSLLKLVRPWPDADTADADAVVDGLLPVFRARADLHHVVYSHEPGAGAVAMPPADVAQVVVNLVDNAMDALTADGRLHTRGCHDDDSATITVTDTGHGAPADGDIFEPGTGRRGRSGLGLAVCRRLVRRAGGSIAVDANADGPGTTVTVRLPRAGAV